MGRGRKPLLQLHGDRCQSYYHEGSVLSHLLFGEWVGTGDFIQGLILDKQALYPRLIYMYWLLISPRCFRFPRGLICPRIPFSH